MRIAAVAVLVGLVLPGCADEGAGVEYHHGTVADYYCQPEPGLVDKQRCTFIIDFGCWQEYRTEWTLPADMDAAVGGVETHYAELQAGRVTACVGTWGEAKRQACECLVAQMHTCERVQVDALDACGFRSSE